ncbi:MAG: FecR domain-containing protein [Leptospiraceae bacterium]|nr:FecR domain-containing protein [Leptospiraceae bacterium]
MKRNLFILLVAVSVAAVQCGGRGDTGDSATVIKTIVSNVQGTAHVEREGESLAMDQGMVLNPADTIITGTDGNVDLAIQEYGIVKIGPGSSVSMQSLARSTGSSRAELRVDRGEVASFVNRSDSGQEYSVVTPTAIAGVRGTSFLVKVDENQSRETRVMVAVLSGSVAVQLPGQDEIIVDKNSQMVIEGQRRITRNMVQPLSEDSLNAIKRMAVFHKSNVLEFNSMLDEVQQSSPELQVLEGDADVDSALEDRDRDNQAERVERASRADVGEHLERDTEGDPIKLEPSESYSK